MNAADLSPQALATLLDEANHAPRESVQSALAGLEGVEHHRVGWLVSHLTQTKRVSWAAIAAVTNLEPPPGAAGLRDLMAWEVTQARRLSPEQLCAELTHSGQAMTVAELIRLNVRHSVWHAGQLAALGRVAGA